MSQINFEAVVHKQVATEALALAEEFKARAEQAEAELARKDAEIKALDELTKKLSESRLVWRDMYAGMGMPIEDRQCMEAGSHDCETSVAAALARLAELREGRQK